MRLFLDFLPITIFFIIYKWLGLYMATAMAIIISIAQVVVQWFKEHSVSFNQWLNSAVIILLGGSTLILHNELFIKWKPTILYWALALACLATQYSKKPLMQYLLGTSITLPRPLWLVLNRNWFYFFILMGLLNLWVAYQYNTNTWVNFKLFGTLSITLLFVIAQAFYLAHLSKVTTTLS